MYKESPAEVVSDITSDIAEGAGKGFGFKAGIDPTGSGKYVGIAFTDSYRAMLVNARDNTLLNAMYGAG